MFLFEVLKKIKVLLYFNRGQTNVNVYTYSVFCINLFVKRLGRTGCICYLNFINNIIEKGIHTSFLLNKRNSFSSADVDIKSVLFTCLNRIDF